MLLSHRYFSFPLLHSLKKKDQWKNTFIEALKNDVEK